MARRTRRAGEPGAPWWAGLTGLWTCRDCDWRGFRPARHEQDTEDEDGFRHWTLCPPPNSPARP